MICPNCGTKNPSNADFCNECGSELLTNNIKDQKQVAKNKIALWFVIPIILVMGFMFQQYLAAIIAVVVVVFVLRSIKP